MEIRLLNGGTQPKVGATSISPVAHEYFTLTSKLALGLVVPIPTLPVDGWIVSGDWAWRLGENKRSNAVMVAVMNALWVLVLWLANMISTSCSCGSFL
jgi:hypothetical protein